MDVNRNSQGHTLQGSRTSIGSSSSLLGHNPPVMTEKVQRLAGRIYQEFERMINHYGEEVIKTVLPLVVTVLDNLDASYVTNQEHEVELELLREDNEQLVIQYEREKGSRKMCEQRLLEIEDIYDSEKKELIAKQESLESIVRMLELKHKNSMEHSLRLEERESELKKEYSKLHDRYTELFKTHVDYMERTKFLMSNSQQFSADRSAESINPMVSSMRSNTSNQNNLTYDMTRSSGPISFGFSSLEVASEDVDSLPPSPLNRSCSTSSTSIGTPATQMDASLVQRRLPEKSQETDSVQNEEINMMSDNIESTTEPNGASGAATTQTKKEERSGNILYQEFSYQDIDVVHDVDEPNDVTGNIVHPGEYASSINDNFFGMGKEVEKLIMENNELLETKNALNVVKDDLIMQVDELQSKLDLLQREVDTLSEAKLNLLKRVSELEDELKKQKETYEAAKEEEEDGYLTNKKRFTRVEMARVLMERNQYKEKLIELQDAVRWTEMLRATKCDNFDKQKKQKFWSFFSNLFNNSSSSTVPTTLSHPNLSSVSSSLRFNANSNHVTPELKDVELGSGRFNNRYRTTKGSNERKSVHFYDQDDNRYETSGWRFSPKFDELSKNHATVNNQSMLSVPLPIHCQPIQEIDSDMHVWCGAGVNLFGGYTSDDGKQDYGVEGSKHSDLQEAVDGHIESLDNEIAALRQYSNSEMKLSSYVWLCMTSKQLSTVSIINANNPSNVIKSFKVCSDHLLCIASVPGVSPNECTDDRQFDQLPKLPDNPKDYVENQVYVAEVTCVISGESSSGSSSHLVNGYVSHSDSDDVNTDIQVKTVLATMWMGSQNHSLFIHSSIDKCEECLASLKLPDSIISIVHVSGKVVVALANGTVAFFVRQKDGQWNLSKYYIIVLGPPTKSVRCLAVVGDNVWCGYRNRIFIINPKKIEIVRSFVADPREEIEVRLMTWYGDGVWVATRLTSVLKLYHAFDYCLMQTFNIEPYVNKMLGPGKFGFSFLRITALLVSVSRLWIGTCYGVIISVPLNESSVIQLPKNFNSVPNVSSNTDNNNKMDTGSVSKCCTTQTQVSLHGHREDVKFFVTVPGCGGMSAASTPSDNRIEPLTPMAKPIKKPTAMLVLCGGKGYIDFRAGDSSMEVSFVAFDNRIENLSQQTELRHRDFIIVWQVNSPPAT